MGQERDDTLSKCRTVRNDEGVSLISTLKWFVYDLHPHFESRRVQFYQVLVHLIHVTIRLLYT